MEKTSHTGEKANKLLLAATGVAGGFINGLLGSGAGIVLIFALRRLLPQEKERDIFALSLCAVFFITACSSLLYGSAGHYSFSNFLPLALPAAAGGIIGAFLLNRLNTDILRKLFSALLIISGIFMMR